MPLSKIQSQVLHLLASQRDPESYVAEERVAAAALNDVKVLQAGSYDVR